MRKLPEESQRATLALVVCCLSRSYCVHNSAFIKPKLPSKMNYEPIYELINYERLL